MKRQSAKLIAGCAVGALVLGGIVALVRAVDSPGTAAPTPSTTGPATRATLPAPRAFVPTTQPAPAKASTIPAPTRLTDAYKIVVMRTVFSRERARPTWGGGAVAAGPSAIRPQDIRPGTGGFASSSPEASVALKGVSLEDGIYIAFVEDGFAHETRGLHTGEPLARGQINAMSLDGIEYATGGKLMRISIGQTLDGATPPPSAYPTASTSTSKPAWPAATSGDTGDRGPRDFRSRDAGSTDGPRDFRSRDSGSADAPRDSRSRDSGADQRGPSADRNGASDQKSAATEQKPPAPPDQQDSSFDPGAFGPP